MSEKCRANARIRFHSFFTHVDNFRTPVFLYLSSKGLDACGDVRTEPASKRDMSRKERSGFSRRKPRNQEDAEKHSQDVAES
jgi:hypothetical protein